MGLTATLVSAFGGTVARRQTVKLMTLVTLALAVVTVVQQWFYWPMMGRRMPLGPLVLSAVPSSLYWVIVTPVALALAARWPLTPGRIGVSLPVHAAAVAGLSVPYLLMVAFPIWLWDQRGDGQIAFGPFLVTAAVSSRALLGAGCYAGAIAIHRSLETVQSLEAGRAKAAQLEAELARAQLRALQMQLHPHFLFNTLQAIRTLIDDDPAAARRTVTLLGDLLRHTLAEGEDPSVPLRRELEFVRGYLAIEAVRLGDRLSVAIDVPADLLDARVPGFLLQPLVENAIRHGIATRREPGRIEVGARKAGATLELTVYNDGPPLARSDRPGGIGLATTRNRLARIYGDRAALDLAADGAGVRATIRVPLA